ncbi:hypothetical protein [Lederbergia galactosidilytica]|nr:hypothetical protein [Lederbergia galactosidilytica]
MPTWQFKFRIYERFEGLFLDLKKKHVMMNDVRLMKMIIIIFGG